MASSGKTITFATDLLPHETDTYNLGNTNYKWKIFGNLTGNASSATKVAAKLDTSHKTYLLGTQTSITGTAANVDLTGDTSVYLWTNTGSLSATHVQVNDGTNERAIMQWNSTDQSLDFIFA